MDSEESSSSKVTNAERLIARDCGSSYKDKLKAIKQRRKEKEKADERAQQARELARARWQKIEKQRLRELPQVNDQQQQQQQQQSTHSPRLSSSEMKTSPAQSHVNDKYDEKGDDEAEQSYVDSIYQAVSMFAPSSKSSTVSGSSMSSRSSKSSKASKSKPDDKSSSKRYSKRSSKHDSSDDEEQHSLDITETSSHTSTNTEGRSNHSVYSGSISRDRHDHSDMPSPRWQEKCEQLFDNKHVDVEPIYRSDNRPAESMSIFGHPSPTFNGFDSQMMFHHVPPLTSQLSSDSFSQMLGSMQSSSPNNISRDIFPSPQFGSQSFPSPSPEPLLPEHRYATPGLATVSPPSTPISIQSSPNGIHLSETVTNQSYKSSAHHMPDTIPFTLPVPPPSFSQEKRSRTGFTSNRLSHDTIPDSPMIQPSFYSQHTRNGVSPRSQSYDPSKSRFSSLTPYLQQSSHLARNQPLNEAPSGPYDSFHADNLQASSFDGAKKRPPSRFTFQSEPSSSLMSPRQLTAPVNPRHQATSLRLLSLEHPRATSAPKSSLKRAWSQAVEHDHELSRPLPSPSAALSNLSLDARHAHHKPHNQSFSQAMTHEQIQRFQAQMHQQQLNMQLQMMQNDPAGTALSELQTRLLMDMIEQQKQALQCDAAMLNQRYMSQQAAQMSHHSINSNMSFSTFSGAFPPSTPMPDCQITPQNLLMFQALQQQAQFVHQQSMLQSFQHKHMNATPDMSALNQMLLLRAAQRHTMPFSDNKPF